VVLNGLLPWTTKVISASFDPMSSTQCTRCVDFVSQLFDYDPAPERLRDLVAAIAGAFELQSRDICLPVVTLRKDSLAETFILRQLRRIR
jgi:hypothetical protein